MSRTPYLDKVLALTWSDAARKGAELARDQRKASPPVSASDVEEHISKAHGRGQGWAQAGATAHTHRNISPGEMLRMHEELHRNPDQTHRHAAAPVTRRPESSARNFMAQQAASAFTSPEAQTGWYRVTAPVRPSGLPPRETRLESSRDPHGGRR